MFVYYCLVLVISIGLFGRLDLSNCGAGVGLVFSWFVAFGLLLVFGCLSLLRLFNSVVMLLLYVF